MDMAFTGAQISSTQHRVRRHISMLQAHFPLITPFFVLISDVIRKSILKKH
jgi:hypothetical protein